jgi:hypothetical protein
MPEESAGVTRVIFLYNAAFPPMAFAALAYVILADAVFAVNRVIGKRLHPRVRQLTRAGYVYLNTALAIVLNLTLWTYCSTDDACAEQPLHRRTCLLVASLALAGIFAARAMDRVFVPMLDIEQLPSYETQLRSRVAHGIVVCVLWMCMAEAEVLGLVLLLAVTARRALVLARPLAVVYIATLRLYALLHTSWVLNNDCPEATTKRMPVAVLAALFVV